MARKGRYDCMVNEERLHYMIRIARFDSGDGKYCKPMEQYARKDYVALQMIKSFIMGTIAFFMFLALWGLYSMEILMEEINSIDLQSMLITIGVVYIVFMFFYLGATYIIFNMKYTKGRKKVKKYYNSLKKVNNMYEREERLKMPGNRERD